jgi:hypothetical protein
MAEIDINHELEIKKRILRRLKKKNLKLDNNYIEIHGPHHPELPFEVYVCETNEGLVAIYPRAMYYLEERDDWLNTDKQKI